MKNKVILSLIAITAFAAAILAYQFIENKKAGVYTYRLGADGGVISTEDDGIRLIVPAQALDQETEVALSADKAGARMGPNQASGLYTIAGLQGFYKPVTVQLKTTAALGGGETYVALGTRAYIQSLGDWSTAFEYLPCTIKDGLVEFTLTPRATESLPGTISQRFPFSPKAAYAAGGPESGNGPPVLQAAVITNQQSSLSSDKRFNLIASVEINSEERQVLLDYLDYCYNFFKQMGFEQSFDKIALELMGETLKEPPGWPLDIYIKDFWFWEKEVAGYFVAEEAEQAGGIKKENAWIEINPLVLRGADNEIWASIIHEYFHFVQYLYGSENEWFDEATATWAEEYGHRKEGEEFNPGNYRKYGTEGFQVLDGPINHSGRSAREHGYGSWAFVKYLVMTPAQGGDLAKAYGNIAAYNSEAQVLNAIRPVREWINQFYITLLTPEGPIPGIPPMAFRRPETNTPLVTLNLADNGQAPVQPLTIPGLGARVVLVRLEAAGADITGGASLEVRAGHEDLTVNLIRMSNFEILASGSSAASTARAAELVKDSLPQQVLALVTNTSEQTAACELDFMVKAAKEFEVWRLERREQGDSGVWLGPNVLMYRNEQGQYYRMEQDLRYLSGSANPPKNEYGLKIEGNRVTIIDYISPKSTLCDVYEGVFSADGKSITGTMQKRYKDSNKPFRNIVYDFRATRMEE